MYPFAIRTMKQNLVLVKLQGFLWKFKVLGSSTSQLMVSYLTDLFWITQLATSLIFLSVKISPYRYLLFSLIFLVSSFSCFFSSLSLNIFLFLAHLICQHISPWRYQNLFIGISNKQFIEIYQYNYSVNQSCIMHRSICTNLKEYCHSDLTNP